MPSSKLPSLAKINPQNAANSTQREKISREKNRKKPPTKLAEGSGSHFDAGQKKNIPEKKITDLPIELIFRIASQLETPLEVKTLQITHPKFRHLTSKYNSIWSTKFHVMPSLDADTSQIPEDAWLAGFAAMPQTMQRLYCQMNLNYNVFNFRHPEVDDGAHQAAEAMYQAVQSQEKGDLVGALEKFRRAQSLATESKLKLPSTDYRSFISAFSEKARQSATRGLWHNARRNLSIAEEVAKFGGRVVPQTAYLGAMDACIKFIMRPADPKRLINYPEGFSTAAYLAEKTSEELPQDVCANGMEAYMQQAVRLAGIDSCEAAANSCKEAVRFANAANLKLPTAELVSAMTFCVNRAINLSAESFWPQADSCFQNAMVFAKEAGQHIPTEAYLRAIDAVLDAADSSAALLSASKARHMLNGAEFFASKIDDSLSDKTLRRVQALKKVVEAREESILQKP